MMRKEGGVSFNGAPPSKNMKRSMGFVMQVRPDRGITSVLSPLSQACEGADTHASIYWLACGCGKHGDALRRQVCTCALKDDGDRAGEQDDLLYETLTVFEVLWYAAQLRLPRAMSKAAKRERVDTVITALGLGSCKDTIVGGAPQSLRMR